MGVSLFILLDIAALLSFGFMGAQLFSFAELLNLILTTPVGWAFLGIGNLASARFVKQNPRVMAIWCFSIAALTVISLLSGLAGLFVTLPLLGHATWHLYRRAVSPEQSLVAAA